MKIKLIIIVLLLGWLQGLSQSHAQSPEQSPATEESKPKKRTKIIYRSYTEVDLSGSAVQGKVRAPEVFYIFQRKRAEGHDVISAPQNLDHLKNPTFLKLKGLVN